MGTNTNTYQAQIYQGLQGYKVNIELPPSPLVEALDTGDFCPLDDNLETCDIDPLGLSTEIETFLKHIQYSTDVQLTYFSVNKYTHTLTAGFYDGTYSYEVTDHYTNENFDCSVDSIVYNNGNETVTLTGNIPPVFSSILWVGLSIYDIQGLYQWQCMTADSMVPISPIGLTVLPPQNMVMDCVNMTIDPDTLPAGTVRNTTTVLQKCPAWIISVNGKR
ncbi:hypothetical protein K1X76_08160 [bacterium]|nr:hypothetical protein [bacterium]